MNTDSNTLESTLQPYIPVKSLRRWRQDGLLIQGEHWVKHERGVAYTPAGLARIRADLAPGILPDVLASETVEEPALRAEVRGHCVNPKYLRALVQLPEGSVLATVRLLAAQASASRFRVGARIQVLADDVRPGQFCTREVKA
jgi:hypothetical protein